MNKLYLALPLTAVLAVSMIMMPTAWAFTFVKDATDDTADPNLDIKQAGIDAQGIPYIKVLGTAGGTQSGAGCNPAFAYVYVFASGNAYAIASHDCFSDSAEGDGATDWHAHGFTAVFAGPGVKTRGHAACITSANDDGIAKLSEDKVSLLGTSETDLSVAATVTIVGDAPTRNCPDVGIGAALYVDFLDVAS